jgi:NDP-sugar pyrophosphorylase family protein
MPLGETPILEVIIRQLARDGFSHITLAVNYHAALIKAFFGEGQNWNVKLDYSLETRTLSTIAPLRLIPDLPESFLLLNGDVLTDLNFRGFYDTHCAERRLFSIAAARRSHMVDYGVLHTDSGKRLTGFEEKPTTRYLVSMGVYAVTRSILESVPANEKFGFDDLMHHCLETNQPVHVETHGGYWLDIGRPDDYAKAVDDFETLKPALLGNV